MLRSGETGLPPLLASAHASYTYAEVLRVATRAAKCITETIGPNARIALQCRDGIVDPLMMLAVFLADCSPLMLRSELPLTVAGKIAAHANAQLVSVQEWVESAIADIASAPKRGKLDDITSWRVLTSTVMQGKMMCATSGSSGLSRVVVHSMQRTVRNAEAHAKSVKMRVAPLIMTALPFAFSYQCLTLFLSALFGKGSLYIGSHREPAEFASAIEQLRPDFVNFSPFLMRSFVRSQGLEVLCAAGNISVGGARVEAADLAILEQLVERGRKCYVTYGITECGPRISIAPISSQAHYDAGVAGRPLEGVQLRICPSSGVIEVKTAYLGLGFANSQTDELTPIPTNDGWFSSSDLGWINARGILHLEGRIDRVILRRDAKIVPELIESAALALPGVAASLVRQERIDGVDHLVCYAQRTPSAEIDTGTLLAHLRQNLPASFIPTRIVVTDDQLVNQIGKLAYLPPIEIPC